MSNKYAESLVDGVVKYLGIYKTTISSPMDEPPSLTMNEEQRVVIDGEGVTKPTRTISLQLVTDGEDANIFTPIPLLNAITGESRESTFTPMEFQDMLYSIYVWQATNLDNEPKDL